MITKHTSQSFEASAPGSLMLLGEHAVLYGKTALVAALDKRINVRLTPREDNQIHIHSDLGTYQTDLVNFTQAKPFHFVLGAIKQHLSKLKQGFNLEINSEFSAEVGFGSSAAVTVATLAALVSWLNIRLSARDMVKQARTVIRAIQGVGSGADVAASVHGGLIAYQAQPLFIEKFTATVPLTVLFCGFKTPTVDVIQKVQEKYAHYPHLFRQMMNAIGQCVLDAVRFVQKQEWHKVGEIMTIQQGLLASLGVSMPILHNLVERLNEQPDIWGAKISGSGMGDCVVGIGTTDQIGDCLSLSPGVTHLPVAISAQGVKCEKI